MKNNTTVEVNFKEKVLKQIEYIMISLCLNVGISFIVLVLFESVLIFNILMAFYLFWKILGAYILVRFYFVDFDHNKLEMVSDDKNKIKIGETFIVNAAMWNSYPVLKIAVCLAIAVTMAFAYYIHVTFNVTFGALVMAFTPLIGLLIRWPIYSNASKFFDIK